MLLLLCLGCNNNSAPDVNSKADDTTAAKKPLAPGFFADVTPATGVNFTYRNGQDAGHFDILGSLGGGVGLIDFDRDGKLDIFLTGGGGFTDKQELFGHPNRLFRNEGDWKFRDVTADVGLPADKGPMYSHGVAVGDYDNDGWADLLVTGFSRCVLYRNNKGKFEDVTGAAKLPATPLIWTPQTKRGHWSTSAAWADFNGDGRLDLYLEHYVNWSLANNPFCPAYHGRDRDVCSPKQFDGIPDQLFFNNGDGTFRDVSKEAGIIQEGKPPDGFSKSDKGLGVVAVDVNDDGKLDIYVANDTTFNYLYLNLGNGTFREVGIPSGTAGDEGAHPNGSMGVDAADYDGSGRFSIFVTNYQHEAHALYRNLGQDVSDDGVNYRLFHYSSRSSGIIAIGLIYVGFGAGFLDFDRDGNEDLFITNGHVVRVPPPPGTLLQRPILLRNLRQPGMEFHQVRFENVSAAAGPFFQMEHMGRGCAFGDLDNDGRTDIVVSHTNETVAVLRNEVKNDNHWLGVELIGTPSRNAVGAKLTLEVGNQKLTRTIKGGGSYLAAHDQRIIFGLGKQTKPGKLTIRWPSGKMQTVEGLKTGQYTRITE